MNLRHTVTEVLNAFQLRRAPADVHRLLQGPRRRGVLFAAQQGLAVDDQLSKGRLSTFKSMESAGWKQLIFG